MTNKRYSKGKTTKTKLKKGEYQRANGSFEFRWTEKVSPTRSISRCVYAKSIAELREKEAAIQKDINEGIKPVDRNVTINHYYKTWEKIKSGIRESTFFSYSSIYKLYIEPEFGETPLREVSYSKLIMFYKDLIEKKGLGITSVDHLNVVLKMVLDVAVRDEVLRTNPCVGALKELQREYAHTIREVKAMTPAEQIVFEDFINKPGKYHCLAPLLTVMLYTGMRVGEVGALKWEDVDFEKNEIRINHSLFFNGLRSKSGNTYTLNPPKTKKSKRSIPMSPLVRSALLDEKQRQKNAGIVCTAVIDGYSDFVFLDDKGEPFHYRKLNHRLDRLSIAIDADVKARGTVNGLTAFPHVHSHMLRHTFATRMREAGADIKATADIMGHTKADLTLNTYTDASGEFKMKAIALIGPDSRLKAAEVMTLPKNLPKNDANLGLIQVN